MAENSKIQWTDHTFNPWIGCTKVSPGCANCYAEMNQGVKMRGIEWGKGKQRVRTSPNYWNDPRKWNKQAATYPWQCCGDTYAGRVACPNCGESGERNRPRVFCASLADWLDDEAPVEWLSDLLHLIAKTPNLDWLLLTKRPENWEARMKAVERTGDREDGLSDNEVLHFGHCVAFDWLRGRAPQNVWLGTTAEDQRWADMRTQLLKEVPARVRFLSVEPLLTPIRHINLAGIDWVILGGESGPNARPCNIYWLRSLVETCRKAHSAVFVKQLGSNAFVAEEESDYPEPLKLAHPKGGDPTEWPADLRIREFPATDH